MSFRQLLKLVFKRDRRPEPKRFEAVFVGATFNDDGKCLATFHITDGDLYFLSMAKRRKPPVKFKMEAWEPNTQEKVDV